MSKRVAQAKVNRGSAVIETLSTGIRAKLMPVPVYLVDKMVGAIKDPKPPKQYIDAKGREEENPFDPAYLAALEENTRLRGVVTMEALILFGVELLDDIPPDHEWLPKLTWLERKGHLDLSEYDMGEPSDREFVYKAFIAISGVDLMKISMRSGMNNEEVALAMDGFRSSTTRSADQDGTAPPSSTNRTDGKPDV